MTGSSMTVVLEHLRDIAGRQEQATCPDAQLLTHFLQEHDEVAFAVLVRRHGPMVWAVCRRMLTDHHDAEDAFQATFLVLVRKAHTIKPRTMVANWLYGVAHHTALKARANALRKKAREKQVAVMPDIVKSAPAELEIQTFLDEELSRLPDKYRLLVVLCDLEGMTRKEAARQLKMPEGTVAGRLARARALLGKRLKRRGAVVTAAALTSTLMRSTSAAGVPTLLLAATLKAVRWQSASQAIAGITTGAMTLAEGTMKFMLLAKLKLATAALLVALTAVGLSALPGPGSATDIAPKEAATPQAKAPAVPKDKEVLQGTWVRVTEELSGEKRSEDYLKNVRHTVSFKDDTFEFQVVDIGKDRPPIKGIFVIDAARQPKWITFTDGDKEQLLGIYHFDKDKLVICGGPFKGKVRPEAFTTTKETDHFLAVYERLREEKKPNQPKNNMQTSTWGPESNGVRARVTAPREIEQGMPLEAALEIEPVFKELNPKVTKFNTFFPSAHLSLTLTNIKTKAVLTVSPYDPAQGMRATDDGKTAVPIDGSELKPWLASFPLVTLRKELQPGDYECKITFSLPKSGRFWRGTEAEWLAEGFWQGTFSTNTFSLTVLPEKQKSLTVLLPKQLRLEKGLKVTYTKEDAEEMKLPLRNGFFVATKYSINGNMYRLSGGTLKPNDVNAIDEWRDYKGGDRTFTYAIEVFETADPPVHFWHPHPESGDYRVLWQRTITLELTEKQIRQMQ